jgi:hypothetical protein
VQYVKNYINELNKVLLARIEESGKFYLSNALINDNFLLRMCIVNFRTSISDIEAFKEFLLITAHNTDAEIRSDLLP